MFSALLIGQEGWFSTKCKLTWKLKGTKYNRTYFQLFPSMLHTEETESGLLPTPRTLMPIDAEETIVIGNRSIRQNGKEFGANLETLASRHLLPTPTTQEPMSECQVNENGRRITNNGKDSHSLNLGRMASMGMLPTPAASDHNARGNQPNWDGTDLVSTIHKATNQPGKTSQLSPQFVMEMMGFPNDWTLLPFLNGEPNQLKQEATQ
jgi:hypothetical protein